MQLVMDKLLVEAMPQEIHSSAAEAASRVRGRGRISTKYHALDKAKVSMATNQRKRVGMRRPDHIWRTHSKSEMTQSQEAVMVAAKPG